MHLEAVSVITFYPMRYMAAIFVQADDKNPALEEKVSARDGFIGGQPVHWVRLFNNSPTK